jgi:hypothetical protein
MQVSFGRSRLSLVRLKYTDTAWRSTEQLGEGSLHPPERMTPFNTKELSFNFSNAKESLLGKHPAADLLGSLGSYSRAVHTPPCCRSASVQSCSHAPHRHRPHIQHLNKREILMEILSLAQSPGKKICSRDAIINMEHKALANASHSKCGKEASGGQFHLQFVTTVSVNVPSKAEQKKNQKIIRQTVMKNFRQQQRSQKLQPKGKYRKVVAATSNSDLESGEAESDGPSSSTSRESSRLQSRSLPESDSKKRLDFTESSQSSRHTLQNPSDIGNPISPLGAGRVDPFRPAYADTVPLLHELIDHCKYIFFNQILRREPYLKCDH